MPEALVPDADEAADVSEAPTGQRVVKDDLAHREADRLDAALSEIPDEEATEEELPFELEPLGTEDEESADEPEAAQPAAASTAAGQPAPAAKPTPPPAEQPAQPDPRDRVFAHLQQQLDIKAKQLEDRAKQLEEIEALRPEVERIRRIQETLEERDPIAALQELGLDPQDVLRAISEKRGVSPGLSRRRAEKQRMDALEKQMRDMQESANQRVAELEGQRRQQEAYATIDTAVKADPVLAALPGSIARDTAILHLHQEHARTGVEGTLEDGHKAAAKYWRDVFHTVLSDPKAREALLGSVNAGQAAKKPTLETAASTERTRKTPKPTKKMHELTDDERFDALWREHRTTARS